MSPAVSIVDLSQVVPPAVDDEEQRRLVRETLLNFNDAVQQQSFNDFYEGVSKAWRAHCGKSPSRRIRGLRAATPKHSRLTTGLAAL